MNLLKNTTLSLLIGILSISSFSQKKEKHAVLISGETDLEHIKSIKNADKILRKNNYKTYIFDEKNRKEYNIESKTTKKNLENFFKNINIDKDDFFMLYLTGHGSRDSNRNNISSIIKMVDGRYLKPSDLEKYLNKINPSKGVLLFTQCYSGGFGKSLGKGKYIAISTSSEKKSSYGTLFGDNFFKSFNNKKADKNNDNKLSVLEASSYAFENDPFSPVIFGYENSLLKKRKEISKITLLPFYNEPRINNSKESKNIYLKKYK